MDKIGAKWSFIENLPLVVVILNKKRRTRTISARSVVNDVAVNIFLYVYLFFIDTTSELEKLFQNDAVSEKRYV